MVIGVSALSLVFVATSIADDGTGAPRAASSLTAPAQPARGPILHQPRMGDPLREITADQLDLFLAGKILFRKPMDVADGVGPIMNATFCGACHAHPRTGGSGTVRVIRFGRVIDGVFDPLEEFGGSLLQIRFLYTDCREEIPEEANLVVQRVTNGATGYGLIEAIPDEAILALEQDPPGVSGRAHIVQAFEAPGVDRVGRFGWKAQVPTVLTFSADAARNELGFTNRFVPDEPDPNGIRPPDIEDCDEVPDPEDGPDEEGFHFIDRVTHFQRYLAAPPQTPRSGMLGEEIFGEVGCAECHHPNFTTSDDPNLEAALRNRVIRPFSDHLLHDMGEASDGIVQGDASGVELRTPPLWGLVQRFMVWHDGRFNHVDFAPRVTGAIEEHGAKGSEAVDSHTAWAALGDDDKASLIRFLASLGQSEFDADLNDMILVQDFVDFAACFTGPGEHYTPDDRCSIHDIDQDGDVDLDDYESFLMAYSGEFEDCNENDEIDFDDIIFGFSEDKDGDGVPDECAPCIGDLNFDGVIGFVDMIVILGEWGDCGINCPADLDDSQSVGLSDLLIVLKRWGPCL